MSLGKTLKNEREILAYFKIFIFFIPFPLVFRYEWAESLVSLKPFHNIFSFQSTKPNNRREAPGGGSPSLAASVRAEMNVK